MACDISYEDMVNNPGFYMMDFMKDVKPSIVFISLGNGIIIQDLLSNLTEQTVLVADMEKQGSWPLRKFEKLELKTSRIGG